MSSPTLREIGMAPVELTVWRDQLPRPNLWRHSRSSLVRPNVPDTMPELLADHQILNAAPPVTCTRLAWQLDHAAPNQSQEARGLQLLKHHVPVSGDDELKRRLQQQTGRSLDTFSGQRASTVDVMYAVT